MFDSPEQADRYYQSLIFYNRYCGEFVVAFHMNAHIISDFISGLLK